MKEDVVGLKLGLCQMPVVLGRPDLNTEYMIREIEQAKSRGVDIILFPEMCVTGYFIGDMREDESFLRSVTDCHKKIRGATEGIVAIFGSLVPDFSRIGENGFVRVYNTGIVYADGKYLDHVVKTLQPNYRMFDEDRFFFSTRKMALEDEVDLHEELHPVELTLVNGRTIRIGLILCEDMWDSYYSVSPVEMLTKEGVDIFFNLSASPWTWQKNRKRHEIVRNLSRVSNVPFVYVNNVGIQNTGKNIIIFDGSSTVYDEEGDPVYELAPYACDVHDIIFEESMKKIVDCNRDDAKELYEAMRCGVKEFFETMPKEKRKVVIGLSGGIDSSLSAALYVDVLGRENVVGINMPSRFNSERTKDIARKLAENLGIVYEVRPIEGIVDAISVATDVKEGTIAYENIQARVRMEILAARAQASSSFYTANWNKVEAAFGYGTMYGDIAGALAILGDLVKREVYQLADYMNRVVFGREVIPQECFDIAPTAELSTNQKDPFDYGTLARRGYHDEMVRAFTEFRKSPEWFLDLYSKGELEAELLLESGTLKRLFPNDSDFIKDLERHWGLFHRAYFKRIQAPPCPIVSRRAFGNDLRESLLTPYYTERYNALKERLLASSRERIALYGGSFNPPALHHKQIVECLLTIFDRVVVVPCGSRRNKTALDDVSSEDRKEMVKRNFDMPNVFIDFSDMDSDMYTPTYFLNERYQAEYPNAEIWNVVGSDLVQGGNVGGSEIQRTWVRGEDVWKNLSFVVIKRPGYDVTEEDLPSRAETIEFTRIGGSSTIIRERIAAGEDVVALLAPSVLSYIEEKKLYKT